ncbi:hypothetical protein ACLB1G_17665 [Oxalobacteraceae bacterium A2-2]
MEFFFSLRYRLAPDEDDIDQIMGRLEKAGCTDAVIGSGRPGWLAFDFCRESADRHDAVRSAIEDIRHALPLASLETAAPEYADKMARDMGLLNHAAPLCN